MDQHIIRRRLGQPFQATVRGVLPGAPASDRRRQVEAGDGSLVACLVVWVVGDADLTDCGVAAEALQAVP